MTRNTVNAIDMTRIERKLFTRKTHTGIMSERHN